MQKMIWKDWLFEAEDVAEYLWCYRDLVEDHVETLEQDYKDGKDPWDAIKELGEGLELYAFDDGFSPRTRSSYLEQKSEKASFGGKPWMTL